ncbi:MAG: SCO family protein [Pedobacter sp.]|nr:MAG: SCO family protein [Pedobacter sp.]
MMRTKNRLFAILSLLTILFSSCSDEETKLPMLVERVDTRMVEGKPVMDTVYKTIPEFSFYNQDSVLINNSRFDGKIYVADFFFTSCPTICPIMHRNMMKIFQKYKDHPDVMLLSHTIDYKYDKPSKLKAYKKKLGADGEQWQYVWGTREDIYATAQKNYLVTVAEDETAAGGYVHQGYLVLVDKNRRVRNAYDGTVDEQVEKLMKDMDILLKEK